MRDLTDLEIDRLSRAMRCYGENCLLYVRYQDELHPNGTVELRKPDLMIGYIDRFGIGRNGETLGAATSSWTVICLKAYKIWRSQFAQRARGEQIDEPGTLPRPHELLAPSSKQR